MKKGVTLIELLIAVVCMTVMIGVVYQLILITERVHIRTGARVEAEYNIREAIDLMVSELRHAGYRHWNVLDSNPIIPNFAFNVDRIGMNSDTNLLTLEGDFDENGAIGDRERITYQFFRGTRTLMRGVNVGNLMDWEEMANNVEDVQFRYRDAKKNIIGFPLTATSTDTIRSIDISIIFGYPVRSEGQTLTTTMNTNVMLRNTYFAEEVQNLLQ